MIDGAIDARGLRCPWPALRLAKAMRDTDGQTAVSLLADDPAASREITALAAEQGWSLDQRVVDGAVVLFSIAPIRRE